MKPTVGQTVTYNTTEADRVKMVESGWNSQEKLTATIIYVWRSGRVDLSITCGGDIIKWETSCLMGDNPGNWNWPVIEK
jgi:hypothetical protein